MWVIISMWKSTFDANIFCVFILKYTMQQTTAFTYLIKLQLLAMTSTFSILVVLPMQ